MKRPSRLVVVGHDDYGQNITPRLKDFYPNKDLLIAIYNLTYGRDVRPRIDESRFGKVSLYNFNEFDGGECQKNKWALENALASGPFFDITIARNIFDVVEEGLSTCDGLIVSCNAGICRSPTVANALNDAYGWGFKGWFTDDEPLDLHRKTIYGLIQNEENLKNILHGFRAHYIYRVMMEEAKRRGLTRSRHP